MAVTFFLADNFEECMNNNTFVQFEEDLHTKLWNDKRALPEEANLLYNLDPHDITRFSFQDVERMIQVCRALILLYVDQSNVTDFLRKLLSLCEQAFRKRKGIMAVGD